jgi:hypothetical protein
MNFELLIEPLEKTTVLGISWAVVFSRAGCPRHKGPSSIVVRASRPHDADSGHQILLSRTQFLQEAHLGTMNEEL